MPAGKIYWTNSIFGRIERANLDGSEIEELVVGQPFGGPSGLALDVGAGKLYWTHANAGTIQRANLDGSNVERLVTLTRRFPRSMAIEPDCNGNGLPDHMDVTNGTSVDCNANGLPDECEPDCNANGIADPCDTAAGTSADCTGNRIPDECEPDCNGNNIADSCDVADGRSEDCNMNGIPDVCDVRDGNSEDCNTNGIPDECDVLSVICLLPNEPGDCDGLCPRYYFNACAGQCEMFIWGCCGGNANNFPTMEACGVVCGDACPNDPNKTGPGTCGCGVPDNTDTDGDGVPDCIDECAGANDAIFAPECNGVIPTVSTWGLAVMVLVLMVIAKICFARRRGAQPYRVLGLIRSKDDY